MERGHYIRVIRKALMGMENNMVVFKKPYRVINIYEKGNDIENFVTILAIDGYGRTASTPIF